jgi:hypothetical protein
MIKNMKKFILLFLLTAVLFPSTEANAQLSKAGTTAGEFLRIPVGARSSAMSAFAATVNDASAMVLNPAGLADITTGQLQAEVTDWYLDMNHTYLGVALPTKKGAVGVHVLAMNFGEFDETTVEAQGKTGRTFNAHSVSFGVSYAQYLIPQFTIGGTAKVVYEQIFNSTASTIAFDVGTIYDTPFYGVRFGVSVTNVGSKLEMSGNDLIIRADPGQNTANYEPDALLDTDAFNLPLMLKVGLAWDAIDKDGVRATIAVDGNSPSNNTQSVSIGGELSLLNEQVFIRGGVPYIGQEDAIETFNGGVGFRYNLRNDLGLSFNYTYHGYQYLGDVNKLSVQVYF